MNVYIVAINGEGGQGGVERVVAQQKNALTLTGAKVTIVDKSFFKIFKTINNKKIVLVLFPLISAIYLWYKKIIGYKFKSISHGYSCPFFKHDLLIAHGSMKGYYLATNTKNMKLLSGSGITSSYEKIAGNFAKKIWAVSKKVKKEWVDNYNINAEKIFVVRNYINLSTFSSEGVTNRNKITFVGRLEKGKGTEDLISLCKQLPYYEFYFASSISPPDELCALSNVKIEVKVPYEKMPNVFKQSRILILPSLYEGFELVTVEALCSGIPVVGYRVGAISELSQEQFPGVFAVNNLQSLINQIKIIMTLNDCEYRNLRENIISVREGFSEDIYKDKLIRIIYE